MSPASQCQWAWVTSRVGRVLVHHGRTGYDVCDERQRCGVAGACATHPRECFAMPPRRPASSGRQSKPRRGLERDGPALETPLRGSEGDPSICARFARSRVDARFSAVASEYLLSTGALPPWRAASLLHLMTSMPHPLHGDSRAPQAQLDLACK